MKLIFMPFIFFSFLSFGAVNNYDIQIDLSINQKPVIKKQLIVANEVKATITEETKGVATYVEVTAMESEIEKNKGILIDLVIGSIAKDGKKTILSKPQILANENDPAKIISANGKNEISISLVAKRQK